MGKPTTNHQQRNRTAFGFATQRQAIDYANEALDLARKDVLDLQGKTLTAFNLMSAGRGDFGTDMLRTVDAHARTREFGALLWNDALVGRAVHETIQRALGEHESAMIWWIDRKIEAREARRPHRRIARWLRGLFSWMPVNGAGMAPTFQAVDQSLVTGTGIGTLIEYERAKPGDRVTVFPNTSPLVAAIERPLEPGELGEGTDEDLDAIRAGELVPDEEEPNEPETADPETVTYPDSDEHLGTDVPGAMDDGIAGADEYRENAKRESEEKPQP